MSEIRGLAALEEARVKKGVCRHCGGVVPCWSIDFGDYRVGERYPKRPKKEHRVASGRAYGEVRS
jgi:hypothetical protein